MIERYLSAAARTFRTLRAHTLVNVLGLTLGATCALLIMLWVQDERGFDRFHRNFRDLYRVVADWPKNDWKGVNATPMPLGPLVKAEVPEVAEAVRVTSHSRLVVRFRDKMFYESRGIVVDPAFFEVFSFPFVKGDPKTAFRGPGDMVMTETMARKYFGGEDPLGRTVEVEGRPAVVTGVVKDPPPASTLRFDFASSFAFVSEYTRLSTHWGALNFDTFLLLKKGADPRPAGPKITALAKANNCPQVVKGASFRLQPLSRLHLDARPYTRDTEVLGDRRLVDLFAAVAAAVLLIACVNFMNLATARSSARAKEVGIRKAVGAGRGRLARQFLGESFVLTGLAFGLALGLSLLLMPSFNRLTGKSLGFDLMNGRQLAGLAAAFLLTGLVSGSYPAAFLSGMRPALVLKRGGNLGPGSPKRGGGGASFRRALVVFQFVLSITLLIGTAAVHRQLRFVQRADLGFDRQGLVQVPLKASAAKEYAVFKRELLALPSVASVSAENYPFSSLAFRCAGNFDWEGREGRTDLDMIYAGVDEDFFETLGLELVAGRPFSSEFPNDKSGAVILNEEAVRAMGLGQAVGKWFSAGKDDKRTIVGVVRNARFQSLHYPVEPRMFYITDFSESEDMGLALVKIRGEDASTALAGIQEVWTRLNPDAPFEFAFLDQTYRDLYVKERRAVRVFDIFAGLAVLISCLGLFGLAAHTAERRTREIGVRKVFGAGEAGLVLLLTKEFGRWVLLAIVLAWPAGYVASRKLLQSFAVRADVGLGIYVGAGVAALLVAGLTVCGQALRAARANPVDSLRYE